MDFGSPFFVYPSFVTFRFFLLLIVFSGIIAIASLAIGYSLGGIDGQNRSILAISCVARNVDLALFIAIVNNIEKEVISTLVAYTILGAIFGVIYSLWYKRKFPPSPQ